MLHSFERTPSRTDMLDFFLERLSHYVAEDVPGHEREWAEAVEEGLYRVATALEQHIAAAKAPDGPLAEVDETRPTLGRQADGLRSDHEELLKQVESLRQRMQHVAESFQSAAVPPKRNITPKIPDFQALRQQVAGLVERIKENKKAETKLVLESVSTDIGVGD